MTRRYTGYAFDFVEKYCRSHYEWLQSARKEPRAPEHELVTIRYRLREALAIRRKELGR